VSLDFGEGSVAEYPKACSTAVEKVLGEYESLHMAAGQIFSCARGVITVHCLARTAFWMRPGLRDFHIHYVRQSPVDRCSFLTQTAAGVRAIGEARKENGT
jgi:hypothetical protein